MRRLLPLLPLGLIALPWGPAAAEDATVQATAQNAFVPGTVTIDRGDTVTWTSTGGVAHTVTSSSSNWSKDDNLPNTQSTTFTFSTAGTYTYYCKIHGTPSSGMRGTVVVRAPSASPTPTTTSPTPSRTSARPTPSRSSSPPPASESPEPVGTETGEPPAATSAPPSAGPAPSPTPSRPSRSAPPVPEGTPPVSRGEGGLGRPEPTGRERGLPIALAVVSLGGIISAQFRALLRLDRD